MKRFFLALQRFFTPHESNNYRARALHLETLTVFLLVVLLSGFFIGKIHSTTNPRVLGFATDINSETLLKLTNEKRTENGLSTLAMNEKLTTAAAAKAKHMFTNNYWAHYAPDGTAPWHFILAAGYQYNYAGENLAKNFLFSKDVVEAWMNSPSHKENILRKEYTDVGFAVVNGTLNGQETTLVVQMFGTPQVSAADEGAREPSTQVTVVPQDEPVANDAPVVLAQSNRPALNLLPVYLHLNFILIPIFMLALIWDFHLATKMGIVRMTGKNLAHLIFMLFMLICLTILIKGAIQ